MLAILRILLASLIVILICICGLVCCVFIPRHPQSVTILSHFFGKLAPIFGIHVEIRNLLKSELLQNYIYVANHQNNYDMIIVSRTIPSHTVTLGKKSLLFIPFFGLLYWLSGNILINRRDLLNFSYSMKSIVSIIKKRQISLCIFPEGTRSYGKGLLPFKMGAFYIAIIAQIPIVPICVSNIVNKIKLNRLYNGLVIIEILPPIDTRSYSITQTRILAKHCYDIMKSKLDQLNIEVINRES